MLKTMNIVDRASSGSATYPALPESACVPHNSNLIHPNGSAIVDNKRLICIAEVRQKTTLSTSSIYAKIRAGTFPKSRRIGQQSVAWLESEVDAWIDSQPVTDTADMQNWKGAGKDSAQGAQDGL